jgi:hypothetical protein
VKFAVIFSAAARRAERVVLLVVREWGKRRPVVEQDKGYCGTARHFCEFSREFAAFSPLGASC